jgi:hypothetical protein
VRMSGCGTFRTWPVWLTMSVQEAEAVVSVERSVDDRYC